MAKQSKNEEVIPVGIVLMAAGFIVVLTAVIIFVLLILPKTSSQLLERQEVVLFPATPAAATDITLLPETPLENEELSTASANALAFVQGQPERIVIPALELDAPVSGVGLVQVQNSGQTYYQWQVPPEFRAGWHNTSAPLGKPGNTVLNGHHNIAGEVFRDLVNLEEGDEIIVYGLTRSYTYTVSAVEILPERDQSLTTRIENASWINPTTDERLTLVTCWPYEDNSHRLVVVAYPAESDQSRMSSSEHTTAGTRN